MSKIKWTSVDPNLREQIARILHQMAQDAKEAGDVGFGHRFNEKLAEATKALAEEILNQGELASQELVARVEFWRIPGRGIEARAEALEYTPDSQRYIQKLLNEEDMNLLFEGAESNNFINIKITGY